MTRSPLPPHAPPPPEIQSAVFRRAGPVSGQVVQPSSPWNLALGLAFAVVLGVIVFATLSAGRTARADVKAPPRPAPMVAPAPPQPQVTAPPSQAIATPVFVRPGLAAGLPAPRDPALDPDRRLHAPVMVVDTDGTQAAAPVARASGAPEPATEPAPSSSAEDQFAARVASGGYETSRATRLRDLTRVAPQGTVIPAVLETAINSDLPGSVRAVVSQDVRGFDGAQVLVPRGSKLIGQYRSGMAYGQTRAFVVWSRILTPEGVSIEVGSPATDPLGRGGLAGETDTHFFERFGGAILLSVMSVGVEALAPRTPSTAIVIGSPDQASRLASLAPQKTDIPVTIKVMQGTPLQVFLVRDLDFTTVMPRR